MTGRIKVIIIIFIFFLMSKSIGFYNIRKCVRMLTDTRMTLLITVLKRHVLYLRDSWPQYESAGIPQPVRVMVS